jgi:hypothetical protein
VGFCHRCKWTANVRTLSRSLGLKLAPESRERLIRRERVARFSEWVKTCHAILVQRLTLLRSLAETARKILVAEPDDETAWTQLADYYHSESEMLAALDVLVFEKVSPWLDRPISRQELEAAFEIAETGAADV